jgi:cysteine desulfuration protein SufE
MSSLSELVESFSLFDSWEDRYAYLIDLGRKLEPMKEELLIDENLVDGCTSKVWMVIEKDKQNFVFKAHSDAQIVKGLVYVLLLAYDGKSAEEIINYDIEEKFKQLGLDNYLSPNRRNGFFAMANKIRSVASACMAA